MNVYIYDKTFDGLLTAVFDAYFRKTFPDFLLSEGDALPLFYDELHTVVTDEEKAARVWRGLQKKVSSSALGCLTQCWLSELPDIGMVIFRYIRKAIDAPVLSRLTSAIRMCFCLPRYGRRWMVNGCI